MSVNLYKCHYCGEPLTVHTGEEIYPHRPDLKNLTIWKCENCNATVGSHKTTGKPLGLVATPELKNLRIQAHGVIDPYWKRGQYPRKKVYKVLQEFVGRGEEFAHIAMLTEDDCRNVIKNFTMVSDTSFGSKLLKALHLKGKQND